MANLITKIPPGATVEIYNCVGMRQVKEVLRGQAQDPVTNQVWAALAILASEKAYPIRVTVRHWALDGQGSLPGPDGAIKAASLDRRGAYSGQEGGKAFRQPPSKFARPGGMGRTAGGQCTMLIASPDVFPAPAGPRFLPADYPGGVSIVAKEVAVLPAPISDARELRVCPVCLDKPSTDRSDYCEDCEPQDVVGRCTHVEKGEKPRACEAPKEPRSEFCRGHRPKGQRAKAKPRATRRRKRQRSAGPIRPLMLETEEPEEASHR